MGLYEIEDVPVSGGKSNTRNELKPIAKPISYNQ